MEASTSPRHHPLTRSQTALQVQRAMTAFPRIIELLAKIDQPDPALPSDADIKQSCELALTAMLLELNTIGQAAAGTAAAREHSISEWLQSAKESEAIEPGLLRCFEQVIAHIFILKTA